MGYPPHERTTLLMGLVSRWRYHIDTPDRAPIRNRRIQSVIGWYPQFRPTFCISDKTMTTHDTRYIYESFFIWITPSTYRSCMVISPISLPITKSFRRQHRLLYGHSRHSAIGFFPLGHWTLMQGFSLSEHWLIAPLMGISPTRKPIRTRLHCRNYPL